MDEKGAWHPVHSVEVFLPWNNTWIFLPQLPVRNHGGGERKMDMTQVMSISTDAGGGQRLYLPGGSSMDWSTNVETSIKTVWTLEYNTHNKTYHWTDNNDLAPPLGNNNYILI